jgi:hypothetical protein
MVDAFKVFPVLSPDLLRSVSNRVANPSSRKKRERTGCVAPGNSKNTEDVKNRADRDQKNRIFLQIARLRGLEAQGPGPALLKRDSNLIEW